MRFTVKNTTGGNLLILMRRLGYHPFRDSFSRRLGSGHYPKFHIYPEEQGDNIIINLHLDQKKMSYSGQVAHSADYDGGLLEEEKNRIISLFKSS